MDLKESIKEMNSFTKILLFGVLPVLIVIMVYVKLNQDKTDDNTKGEAFSFVTPELTDTFSTKSNIDLYKDKKFGKSSNSTFGNALTYETKKVEVKDSIIGEEIEPIKEVVKKKDYNSNRGYEPKRQKKETKIIIDEEVEEHIVSSTKKRRSKGAMGNMTQDNNNHNSIDTKKINAVIHNGNKNVKAGNTVRIRVTEDCVIAGHDVRRNSMLSGIADFSGERLKIAINNINNNGQMYSCDLVIYDNDGLLGLYVPGGLQIEKDVANEGVSEAETKVNIPIIGSVSTNAFKKIQEDPSCRVYDNHKITLRIVQKK